MVAEEVLCRQPEDPKQGHKGPSKSVKINRATCLVGIPGSTAAASPHRRQKFNGDQKGKEEYTDRKEEKPSHHQSHSGCVEVEQAAASKKLLQENVVSCTSEHLGPNTESVMKTRHTDLLPATPSSLDGNNNTQEEESDGNQILGQSPIKEEMKTTEEQALQSPRISEHRSNGQLCGLTASDDQLVQRSNDEKDHVVLSEKRREHMGEAQDSGTAENGKVLKEKDCEESSKIRDQRGGVGKKVKEHKDNMKREDKKDRERDRTREKSRDKVKEEAREEDKKQKASESDRNKVNDRKTHKDKSKEDKHNQSEKSNRNHKIKEETSNTHLLPKDNGSNLKGSVLKRTLVDLDLFQETLTGGKRQKSKRKSQDRKGEDKKVKQENVDEKGPKRRGEGDGDKTKGIKRELEEEESKTVRKKSKTDSESDEGKVKARSKKRKNTGEAGKTKAKKTKDAKEEESKWKWSGWRPLTVTALRAETSERTLRHWWEEKNHEDGVKWKFLEHRGPYFAPPYEPLPDNVNFYYDGQVMKLSPAAEEVATFYGKMLDHEYTTKEIFQNNFYTDWRTQMTKEEKKTIKHLHKCDFSEIHKYFFDKNEARKALPKEEKQKLKEEASALQEEYGYCMLDGHREKIGNFKIEPPGLFRGRGDHPKMGMLKLRIKPEDVIINCSSDSKVPEPPSGHRWKEVRFDNSVTWLASWTENIQGSIKYIMLNPSSKLKGEKDWQKYEIARRLKNVVDQIRSQYRTDWKSREMKKRQRAVALYFIDKLALRAGNEKEEGETADTVGCCSLRVEHIKLYPELDGQQHVVEFDFLGKDSIRYYNKVPVEKEVFKNLKRFMENKDPEDDVFDRLNTSILNKHLQDLMDGLTAKVFRTYNASITLQNQLKELTNENDNVAEKILSYNRANRAVALLCNHQRAPPKTFEKSMQNLQGKIDAKEKQLKEAKKELKRANADYKAHNNERTKKEVEKKKKQVERLKDQLMKLKLQATDKEENKQIALGTSKLNYLDPRITVAWCKKYGVPIEKIYNKTQRDKFAWAIDMTNEDFEF